MKLKVFSTGSKGNCYCLDDGRSNIVLDAGVPFMAFKKAVGFDLQSIDGCLVTHGHADHAKAAADMVEAGIDVHMSRGTMEDIFDKEDRLRAHVHTHLAGDIFHVGPWAVKGFYIHHDVAEPFGFILRHTNGAKGIYLTDTSYCEYDFPKLNFIIIECNYILKIINERVHDGYMNHQLRSRIMDNHMGLETLIPWLQKQDLNVLEKIILVHLSDGNSDAQRMKEAVQTAVGVDTITAEAGQIIELSNIGF